jgi:2-C-methyl-D-erythritol 4-phosphate cytidylyltransferase
MKAAAIIVAAGVGRRFGSRVPKQFLRLSGVPVFLWSVRAFQKVRDVAQVILVVQKSFLRSLGPYRKRYSLDIVQGGSVRADSVRAGLSAVRDGIGLVAVHDSARPLVTPDIIRKALRSAASSGASVVAVPCRDTVKESRSGMFVSRTIPRTAIWLAQTPQVFKRKLLEKAYATKSTRAVTDDAQAAERAGIQVRIVPGDPDNIKITEPGDLRRAELLMRSRNIRNKRG